MLGKQKIILRADGNNTIGLGHISRCVALAELLSDDFEIVFATCEPGPHILNDIKSISHKVIALPTPGNVYDFNDELSSHLTGGEIVVLDGYNFTPEYERAIKVKSAAVLAVDDVPGRHFAADGVINFCGAVQPTDYSREFYTQLYLGLDYLFLRKPFLRSLVNKKDIPDSLLLNMGGTDPRNETCKILKEILEFDFSCEIKVIVGQGYRFKDSLKPLVDSHASITLHQGLSAKEMFKMMSTCSMAILPPSTVALEYLSTGGLLFLNQTAENQRCIKAYLLKMNSALNYSEFSNHITAKDRLKHTAVTPVNAFDGSSLRRVKKLFASLSISNKMNFRKATPDDVKLVYSWATDPGTRRYAYSRSEIPWTDHVQWFTKKISDPLCEYFVIEIDNTPVGQIRFELSNDEGQGAYVISYLIDKNWRGRGLANSLLTKGLQKLKETCAVKKVIGYVQILNIASMRVFSQAGFSRIISLKYPDSIKFELSF